MEIGSGKCRRRTAQETECPKLYFIFSQAQPIHLTHDSITLIFPTIKRKVLIHISRVSPCQQGEAEQRQEAWHCVSHTQKIFSLLCSFTSCLWNALAREGKWKGCLEEFFPKQMEKEGGKGEPGPNRVTQAGYWTPGTASMEVSRSKSPWLQLRLLKPKAVHGHRARSSKSGHAKSAEMEWLVSSEAHRAARKQNVTTAVQKKPKKPVVSTQTPGSYLDGMYIWKICKWYACTCTFSTY